MPEQSCRSFWPPIWKSHDGHTLGNRTRATPWSAQRCPAKLLGILDRKRECCSRAIPAGLSALLPEEEELCVELQACHDRRQQLLAQAAADGMPADSIRSLAGKLPRGGTQSLRQSLDEASQRSRLLRHQSMAQWVAVQARHASSFPHDRDYCYWRAIKADIWKGGTSANSGALMDQAV